MPDVGAAALGHCMASPVVSVPERAAPRQPEGCRLSQRIIFVKEKRALCGAR
jgi:hypothetical protein